jgi:hypothetical protein
MDCKICSICKKRGKYYFNTDFNDYDEFKQKIETIEEMKFKIMYDDEEENDDEEEMNMNNSYDHLWNV